MRDQRFESDWCQCSPTTEEIYHAPDGASRRTIESRASTNVVREIATEILGNSLIIRMEKDKTRSKKNRRQHEAPCDCDVVEIERPSRTKGPSIVNPGSDNRISFAIDSTNNGGKDDSIRSGAMTYEIGACEGDRGTNDQCRTIVVRPQLDGPGSQEVRTERTTEGQRDVFVLRIKKKGDHVDPKQRNIELELRTPRPPTPPIPPPSSTTTPSTQKDSSSEGPSTKGKKNRKTVKKVAKTVKKGQGKTKKKGQSKGRGKTKGKIRSKVKDKNK